MEARCSIRISCPQRCGTAPFAASVKLRAATRASWRSPSARPDGSVSTVRTSVFPHQGDQIEANERYVDRLVKFLLWQRGGCTVTVAGDVEIARFVESVYSPSGARAFDHAFMGDRVYGTPLRVHHVPYDQAPEAKETGLPLGRNLEGCRIGFDLGGSDRKVSAVIDGEVVFTEEQRLGSLLPNGSRSITTTGSTNR